MAEPLDFEALAWEADRYAETAQNVPMAQGWRDIARGYRMLAKFAVVEQINDMRSDRMRSEGFARYRGWLRGR